MVFKRKKPAGLAKTLTLGILILVCVCACQAVSPDGLLTSATHISTGIATQITDTPPVPESNDLLVQWLADRQTPLLMIHNDVIGPANLTLLDTSTAETISLTLPTNTRITNINNSLSPDQKYLALLEQVPGDPTQDSLILYDLLQATIIHRINIAIPGSFDAAQVFPRLSEDEQAALKARNLGAWILQESLGLSLGTYRWSRDAQSLYFANYCNDGFACLFRYDLDSDHPAQLETEAGFFDSIRLSPDGSKLMLAKSVVPQQADFPLTHSVILDKDGNTSLMPAAQTLLNTHSQNEWFSNNEIIRTYFDYKQMRFQSIEMINLQSNQVETLASQPFDDYLLVDGSLYLLAPVNAENQSLVKISLAEKPEKELTIEDKCSNLSPSSLPDYSAYLACENGLYGISADFETTLLLPMSENPSFSPDSQHFVTYTFNGFDAIQPDLSVYDTDFALICKIPGQNVRQVIWYPDSQGFLYLNSQGLYRIYPLDCTPHLILNNTSDDYRHLDALWYSP